MISCFFLPIQREYFECHLLLSSFISEQEFDKVFLLSFFLTFTLNYSHRMSRKKPDGRQQKQKKHFFLKVK